MQARPGLHYLQPPTRICSAVRPMRTPLHYSFADAQVSGDEKVAPLTKRGIALLFEPSSGVGMPFEVEVIVH